jgi:hypothetical protein
MVDLCYFYKEISESSTESKLQSPNYHSASLLKRKEIQEMPSTDSNWFNKEGTRSQCT